MTTITEQVREMRAARAANAAPSSTQSPAAREQAQLDAGGIPDGVIAVGSTLPDADVLDAHTRTTTLYSELRDGLAVLVFYRGAWCPYCNITLRNYQSELLPELTRRGVALVAVSPQVPDETLTMTEKNELSFTVLTDPGNRLAGILGIVTQPTDEHRADQLARGVDLAANNADKTPRIPMPTTLILDVEHVVRWIDVHPNYTTRTEAGEILAALDALN